MQAGEIKHKRLSDEDYKYIFGKVPRVCVDLVIDTPDGFVMVKREIPPHEGKWHLPGGRVLMRESLKDALLRIGQKEIGVIVGSERLIGYMEFPNDGEDGFAHSVSLVFMVDIKSGKLKGSKEGEEVRIFVNPPGNTMPEHKSFLDKYLNEEK